MPTEIQYLEDKKIVSIKQSGKISAAEMRKTAMEAQKLAIENGTNLVLSDNTEMVTDARTTDLFNLPRLYEELGVSKSSKIAIVMNIVSGRKDYYQFYETVCRNVGYDVKLFNDTEAAEKWLLQ